MMDLPGIVAANRAGDAVGIPSYCTAHGPTLQAILAFYRDGDGPILIEATCNQVNQDGGYTGMTPAHYAGFVADLAHREGIAPRRLMLGGDHLGPNPWRHLPSAQAMDRARRMVADYVAAGFSKIHLDASMACVDDGALDEAVMAERAADLCAAAEAVGGGRVLHYVIGTEVPVPGGETQTLDAIAITRPDAARHTLALHRAAFARRGLQGAFERVLGMVVQPGVDFGNAQVFAFEPSAAAGLSRSVLAAPGLVFEAHSTDYQSVAALRSLVGAHFAFLKVGPELTFAYRQAILALAGIEAAMNFAQPSDIVAVIKAEMQRDPSHWRAYIAPDAREDTMLVYGLSDRVRYYWSRPPVEAALARLRGNLAAVRPEPGLVAQHAGEMVEGSTDPAFLPDRIIATMIGKVVAKYRAATGN